MFENLAGLARNSWNKIEGFFNGSSSSARSWRYAQKAAELQDQYQRKLIVDSPSLERQGLENAGFNPLLAIQGGVSSPSSAVQVQSPKSDPRFGLAEIVNAISSAFGNYSALAKLGGEVALTRAQADSTRANSAADVVLKTAEASKILKEADSIDPKIRKQNDKYGYGLVGEAMKFVRTLAEGLGSDDIDYHVDTPLKQVSVNSAKGLEGAVKVINEKARLVQEERKKRVKEGRANPRREGRKGRR